MYEFNKETCRFERFETGWVIRIIIRKAVNDIRSLISVELLNYIL